MHLYFCFIFLLVLCHTKKETKTEMYTLNSSSNNSAATLFDGYKKHNDQKKFGQSFVIVVVVVAVGRPRYAMCNAPFDSPSCLHNL